MTATLIGSRFAAVYPDARCDLDHRSPFEPLAAVVLFVQITDAHANQVTSELFIRCPDAEHLAGTEQNDVEETISSLGLYRSKVRSPTELARALVVDRDDRVPGNLDEPVKFPGVGCRTVNVVPGDAFDTPGITPDTHIIRISDRLGWVHSTKPDDTERVVRALFPPGEWVALCHWIIRHGRRYCRARTPACTTCPVGDLCPSPQVRRRRRATA